MHVSETGGIELDDLSTRTGKPTRQEDSPEPHETAQGDHPKDDGVIASWAWTSAGL